MQIGVKLTTYGDDLKEIPIGLYNKEKLVAKTLVKLESKSKNHEFYDSERRFNGYFSISDNGLDYDNQLYFSISKPEKKM